MAEATKQRVNQTPHGTPVTLKMTLQRSRVNTKVAKRARKVKEKEKASPKENGGPPTRPDQKVNSKERINLVRVQAIKVDGLPLVQYLAKQLFLNLP